MLVTGTCPVCQWWLHQNVRTRRCCPCCRVCCKSTCLCGSQWNPSGAKRNTYLTECVVWKFLDQKDTRLPTHSKTWNQPLWLWYSKESSSIPARNRSSAQSLDHKWTAENCVWKDWKLIFYHSSDSGNCVLLWILFLHLTILCLIVALFSMIEEQAYCDHYIQTHSCVIAT